MPYLMYESSYSNELYHHGVLGQKWGVRRYQNADGSLTAKGRKRYERDLGETSSINKGAKLYRVTANKDEELGGSKYVTYYQSDRNFYRGAGADWIKHVANTNTVYEKTYVAQNELKIAKGKDIADALSTLAIKDKKMDESSTKGYADFLATNSGYKGEKTLNTFYNAAKNGKSITDKQAKEILYDKYGKDAIDKYCAKDSATERSLISNVKYAGDRYKENYNNAKTIISKNEDQTTTAFIRSVGMGTDAGKYTKQRVETYLKGKGYQGMSDLAGMGGNSGWNREARQTMILFDTDSNLSTKKTKKVDYTTTNRATGNYYYWRNATKSYSNLRFT